MADEATDTTPTPEDQTVTAPSAEPTPPQDAPSPDQTDDTQTDGDQPADETPQPSAFDNMVDALKDDPDALEAAIARARDYLPEERRNPKPEPVGPDPVAEQQRRAEERRRNEAQRDEAIGKITSHLSESRTRFLSNDAQQTDDFDYKAINEAINELVQAEVALDKDGTREAWGNALQTRLNQSGGPIADDRIRQLISDVAQDKVPDGMLGAFLDEWGNRRYQQGLEEGEGKAKSRDDVWRQAEAAAIRAEQLRDKNTEPDSTMAPTAGGTDEERLNRLSGFARDEQGNRIPPTAEDREWLRNRQQPVRS